MTPLEAFDLRRATNRLARATNAQQKRLVSTYDAWAVSLERELAQAIKHLASAQELERILNKRLPDLEKRMLDVTHDGVLAAQKLVVGRDKPTPRILAARDRHLIKNDELVTGALLPFIGERLKLVLPQATEPKQLTAGLVAQRSFPAAYAGGFWAMLFETKRAVGQDEDMERKAKGLSPVPVRWVLDPLAEHCQPSAGFYGCPELAREYPSWDALPTVPAGQVTCRGQCRCRLEIYRDGQWVM